MKRFFRTLVFMPLLGMATPVQATPSGEFNLKSQEAQAQSDASFRNDRKPFVITAPRSESTFEMDKLHETDDGEVNLSPIGIAPIRSSLVRTKNIRPIDANNHDLDMTTNAPRVNLQEDVSSYSFESCVRIQVNNGTAAERALRLCQRLNPGVSLHLDGETPNKVETNITPPKDETIHFTKKDQIQSQMAEATYKAQVPGATPSILDIASSSAATARTDCDISRDITVMLSDRCLHKADSDILAKMGGSREITATPLASPQGLRLPSALQPTPPTPNSFLGTMSDGQHSLYKSPQRYKGVDRDIAEMEGMTLPSGSTSQSRTGAFKKNVHEPDEDDGPIICRWTYGAFGGGVMNKEGRSTDMKSCIRKALKTEIMSGIISIAISDRGLTNVIECHRRNGKDVCVAIR